MDMVVMDSSLMMRFTPLIEATPELAPEVILTYDTSCLPPAIPAPEPTPVPPVDEPPDILIQIPPLEGEFLEVIAPPIENNVTLTLADDLIEDTTNPRIVCEPNENNWCDFLQQGDVFTYADYGELISMNRVDDEIITFKHILPPYIENPTFPSWGVVDAENSHYRLAFYCTVYTAPNKTCYWDSQTQSYHHTMNILSSPNISPDGLKISYTQSNSLRIWDLVTNSHTSLNLKNESDEQVIAFAYSKWANDNQLYYLGAPLSLISNLDNLGIWRYDFITETNTQIIAPDPINNLILYYNYAVYENNQLYWSNELQQPTLTYPQGNWSFPVATAPFYYPVYFSPRPDDKAIGIVENPNNSEEYCVYLFGTSVAPTNPTEIGCRPMVFGLVDWEAGIDLSPLADDPIECPPPANNLAGTMSTTQNIIPEICQEPPPSDECLAETTSTTFISRFTIRKSPIDLPDTIPPSNELNIITRLDAGISVSILGRNIGVIEPYEIDWWWYVEIPTLNVTGWIISDAIIPIINGCDIFDFNNVPILDYVSETQNDTILYNPI